MIRRPALLLSLPLLLALPALAQHPRLLDSAQPETAVATGAGPEPPVLAAAAPRPPQAMTVAAAPDREVGDATRRLLQLQASGQAAAPALPLLGQPAGAAYQRYLDSFSHAIPEFFDSTVPAGSGGSGGR